MAKYTVTANLCDGNDYIRTWDGGTFDDLDAAVAHYETWWPPKDEIRKALRDDLRESGLPIEEYDLQFGVWDEDGNDYKFYSEGFVEEEIWR